MNTQKAPILPADYQQDPEKPAVAPPAAPDDGESWFKQLRDWWARQSFGVDPNHKELAGPSPSRDEMSFGFDPTFKERVGPPAEGGFGSQGPEDMGIVSFGKPAAKGQEDFGASIPDVKPLVGPPKRFADPKALAGDYPRTRKALGGGGGDGGGSKGTAAQEAAAALSKEGEAALNSPEVQAKAEQGAAGQLPPHEQAAFDEMLKAIEAQRSGYDYRPMASYLDKWFDTDTAQYIDKPLSAEAKRIQAAELKLKMAQRQTERGGKARAEEDALKVAIEKAKSTDQIRKAENATLLEKLRAERERIKAARKGGDGSGSGGGGGRRGRSDTGDPELDRILEIEGSHFEDVVKAKVASGQVASKFQAIEYIRVSANQIQAADPKVGRQQAVLAAYERFLAKGMGGDADRAAVGPSENLVGKAAAAIGLGRK